MGAPMPGRSSSAGLGESLRHWYRQRPGLLTLCIVLIPVVGGVFADDAIKAAADRMHLTGWQIAALVIFILLLLSSLSFLAFLLFGGGGAPPPPPSSIEVKREFSRFELEQIRNGLHRAIYGGSAPNDEDINRMYAANPRLGIGLYDRESEDFVAFATTWPIRDATALRLISGETTENELTSQDVLPAAENGRANYVLIPAFGAAKAWQAQLGFKLFSELKSALKENYLAGRGRSITLIATGFSKDGEAWCKHFSMTRQCEVALENPNRRVPWPFGFVRKLFGQKKYPIFTRQVTAADLRRA